MVWAILLTKRAKARIALGEGEEGEDKLRGAVEDCEHALTVFSPEETPQYWKVTSERLKRAVQMLERKKDSAGG